MKTFEDKYDHGTNVVGTEVVVLRERIDEPCKAKINREDCSTKSIEHKIEEVVEALATQLSWHPVGSSLWMPLLAHML